MAEMDKVVSRQPLIHLMEHRTSLGDPALEDVLIKVPRMRCVAGPDFISKRLPREATMRQGRCIQAALIAAPRSTSMASLLQGKCFTQRRRLCMRIPATNACHSAGDGRQADRVSRRHASRQPSSASRDCGRQTALVHPGFRLCSESWGFLAQQAVENALKGLHLRHGQQEWGHGLGRSFGDRPAPVPTALRAAVSVLEDP